MIEFSNYDIIRNLIFAAQWTVLLSLVAFIGGTLVALVLTALRLTRNSILQKLVAVYIELFQGTPLLMQMFLCFFGVSLLGYEISAWSAAILALTLFTSAFLVEIWRGCIDTLPKGQWEASRCLGMSFLQILRYIILPQALRVAIAPTVGFSVQVVKGTALASVIGFVELTKAGTMLNNATFEPFKVFAMVAVIYFLLCYPLSLSSKILEKKFNVSR
ncbi:ABC transporter permease subunit [Marinomonas mediterranea]|jgi:amino acid ABC transporter membrane protein 2, PAAT family (TC 3.A.1.3.-)|uniref:Polar amino acid ABC transporter, inner membrane subunit n=1 Tax=Marinomonas mediterranea (strain ATCC 700492 / JCM 21426 / NBRC 103028 / MMB-1) TaxID=717774 RepID=F2JW79_MARM1|nr:amino acid ABC transporter permease [Marinomonas mediterranea]ADZ89467.1 polar amino acid ABC transporter, inner membrane subunit [Marinomonas mediterranea MMB-1]WCN11660.1 ABC transporter permease subunit [Marinomonas mediterranea]WCN15718.1 ABC transporter permease subunit [Marinomonas mediterranea MMB-1]